jgi:glucosamine--fructose-6-phosphate aminotransferase (isomerizing)
MFVREIQEQPDAIREVVRYYQAEGADLLDRLTALRRGDAEPHGPVYFTGMGSSLYATDAVLPVLAAGDIDARVIEAGEWLHYGPQQLPHGSLVVAVSQSGESVETRSLAERLSGTVPVLAVTNDPESRMARAARVTLPIRAGHEEMIAAKTNTNTVAVLHLAASALLGEARAIPLGRLSRAAEGMEQALDTTLEPSIRQAAKWLDEARALHAVARGPSLAAARAGALVLGEGAHLNVAALPAGSFRHGPIELAGPGHAAIIISPSGPTRELLDRLAGDLLQGGSRVLLITDEAPRESGANLIVLPVATGLEESVFSLPATILIERVLAAVADRRGLTPGQFRFSGKITQEE